MEKSTVSIMANSIQNRSEVLFLYDVSDVNPNGDPLNENKPRIDHLTEKCMVTDVRLKRTVRDYLSKYEDKDIFVAEEQKEDGKLKSRKEKLREISENMDDLDMEENPKKFAREVIQSFIDLRLFGATIAVEEDTITQIGPVQFNFGRTLHEVEPEFVKGTTVLPSGEGKKQGTFTEIYVLPYALIGFHGLVNENAASETSLDRDDIDLLLKGLWNGTKNLITRSKVGQMPRMLVEVVYKESNYHIGDLDDGIELETEYENPKKIRSPEDYVLDCAQFSDALEENKDKIDKIRYRLNSNLRVENLDFGQISNKELQL